LSGEEFLGAPVSECPRRGLVGIDESAAGVLSRYAVGKRIEDLELVDVILKRGVPSLTLGSVGMVARMWLSGTPFGKIAPGSISLPWSRLKHSASPDLGTRRNALGTETRQDG
jgi:hypothetical protein